MLRCLGNRVLLFPLAPVIKSPSGIHLPQQSQENYMDGTRFWVAAKGPKVVDVEVYDHVICVMPPEEHARLEGGARVLDAGCIIAKIERET